MKVYGCPPRGCPLDDLDPGDRITIHTHDNWMATGHFEDFEAITTKCGLTLWWLKMKLLNGQPLAVTTKMLAVVIRSAKAKTQKG